MSEVVDIILLQLCLTGLVAAGVLWRRAAAGRRSSERFEEREADVDRAVELAGREVRARLESTAGWLADAIGRAAPYLVAVLGTPHAQGLIASFVGKRQPCGCGGGVRPAGEAMPPSIAEPLTVFVGALRLSRSLMNGIATDLGVLAADDARRGDFDFVCAVFARVLERAGVAGLQQLALMVEHARVTSLAGEPAASAR